jgi:hypothetical protein
VQGEGHEAFQLQDEQRPLLRLGPAAGAAHLAQVFTVAHTGEKLPGKKKAAIQTYVTFS